MRHLSFGLLDLFEVDPARPAGESLAEHYGQLRMADELGLDYLFVAERHFAPEHLTPAPSLHLAALAGRTTRARLGVLAYTLPIRHPVLLAEEISLLDHISGGRVDVGVGLGHVPDELRRLGVPFDTRRAIFEEHLALMRRVWSGEAVTSHGRLALRDVVVPAPLQSPHPPLWYAGTDPAMAG